MVLRHQIDVRHRQHGATVVEFSIASSLFFLILFSLMEFGRVIYTFSLLQESTRSAARTAVVSDLGSVDIVKAARQLVPELRQDQLDIRYLDQSGAVITEKGRVKFVSASIKNYEVSLLIPLPGLTGIHSPSFISTQVAESLGDNPWQ